jgi:hypothetical protein
LVILLAPAKNGRDVLAMDQPIFTLAQGLEQARFQADNF